MNGSSKGKSVSTLDSSEAQQEPQPDDEQAVVAAMAGGAPQAFENHRNAGLVERTPSAPQSVRTPGPATQQSLQGELPSGKKQLKLQGKAKYWWPRWALEDSEIEVLWRDNTEKGGGGAAAVPPGGGRWIRAVPLGVGYKGQSGRYLTAQVPKKRGTQPRSDGTLEEASIALVADFLHQEVRRIRSTQAEESSEAAVGLMTAASCAEKLLEAGMSIVGHQDWTDGRDVATGGRVSLAQKVKPVAVGVVPEDDHKAATQCETENRTFPDTNRSLFPQLDQVAKVGLKRGSDGSVEDEARDEPHRCVSRDRSELIKVKCRFPGSLHCSCKLREVREGRIASSPEPKPIHVSKIMKGLELYVWCRARNRHVEHWSLGTHLLQAI